MIVSSDNVINLCGPKATDSACMTVSAQNSLSETEPVLWQAILTIALLPLT